MAMKHTGSPNHKAKRDSNHLQRYLDLNVLKARLFVEDQVELYSENNTHHVNRILDRLRK